MSVKKIFACLSLAVVTLGAVGCGGDDGASTNVVGKEGGNNCTSGSTCKTVTIGSHTWMAENLNIVTDSSLCYNNSADSCRKYGRLYTWEAAMSVCPSGWHLPSNEEWQALVDYAGGSSVAGKALKSKTGWNNNGNGTDDHGFSALPGGRRDYNGLGGGFNRAGTVSDWWTATERSDSRAYSRGMYYDGNHVGEGYNEKGYVWSVRCVMN